MNDERVDAAMRQRIERSVLINRRVLNRLEPHLGCVVCRGPLTDGVCPSCDPDTGASRPPAVPKPKCCGGRWNGASIVHKDDCPGPTPVSDTGEET